MYGASYTTELRFYEYNDNNELIDYKIWKNPSGQKQFTAADMASKVVVFLDAKVSKGDKTAEFSSYDVQVYYLKKGSYITIVQNSATLGQKYNPLN